MPDPAYVSLALVPGIGPARLAMLLRAFGSAGAALQARVGELRTIPGISPAAATAIGEADREAGRRVLDRMRALGGVVLAPDDEAFPRRLTEIPDPPPLLFAAGAVELLASPGVAVVGSRDHTAYGERVCRALAGACAAAGLTVVSGMARGLDAVAHVAALDVGGGTVGVLGNGLGVVYPAANRALYDRMVGSGCLVTEHPPGERPNAGSFPRRNRIISGLCRATVVVEARAGSGALITADCALAQGREVLAVPGPITSPLSAGTNRLIQLGAKPVLEPRDVLEEYGVDPTGPRLSIPADLSEAERKLVALLDGGERDADQLARTFPGPASELLAALTGLEIRGLVRRTASGAVERVEGFHDQLVP